MGAHKLLLESDSIYIASFSIVMKYDTIVKSNSTLIVIHDLSSVKIDFPFQRE